MTSRKLRKRVSKKLTKGDRTRHAEIREQINQEKPRLRRIGRKARDADLARQARLKETLAVLKETREKRGLTLASVALRTGIDKGNLSRLENAIDPNPTIETLDRYAAALGKELIVTLADRD